MVKRDACRARQDSPTQVGTVAATGRPSSPGAQRGAEAIVTFNLKHFPDTATDPWNIEVQHPDEFLVHLYYLNPDLIVHILYEQAAFIGKSLSELLSIQKQGTPRFVQLLSDSLGLS